MSQKTVAIPTSPAGTDALDALLAQPRPRWPVIEAAASALLQHGHGSALVAPLRRATIAFPVPPVVWWLLAAALHQAQRHEEAIPAAERARTLDPADRRTALLVAQLRL